MGQNELEGGGGVQNKKWIEKNVYFVCEKRLCNKAKEA